MEPVATRPRVSALDVSDLHVMTVRLAIKLGLVTALVIALVWVLTGESIALVLSAGSLMWSGLGLDGQDAS